MDDLISRQAALDALNGGFTVTGRENAEVIMDFLNGVCKKLRDLPSAERRGWTFASDLPEMGKARGERMSETKERRKAPKMKTANILGTIYRVEYAKSTEDSVIGKEGDAYCDWTGKKIVLQDPEEAQGNLADMDAYWRKTLRHEIIHAFLFESGLAQNSFQTDAWAQNEEMIDWFAFNAPKIYEAFVETDCL